MSAEHCRCGRCGLGYARAAFAELAPVRTLDAAELAAHVVRWPDGVVVDVRVCARCKAPIARLNRLAS
jgi:hypothetical protein